MNINHWRKHLLDLKQKSGDDHLQECRILWKIISEWTLLRDLVLCSIWLVTTLRRVMIMKQLTLWSQFLITIPEPASSVTSAMVSSVSGDSAGSVTFPSAPPSPTSTSGTTADSSSSSSSLSLFSQCLCISSSSSCYQTLNMTRTCFNSSKFR